VSGSEAYAGLVRASIFNERLVTEEEEEDDFSGSALRSALEVSPWPKVTGKKGKAFSSTLGLHFYYYFVIYSPHILSLAAAAAAAHRKLIVRQERPSDRNARPTPSLLVWGDDAREQGGVGWGRCLSPGMSVSPSPSQGQGSGGPGGDWRGWSWGKPNLKVP